MKNRRWTHIIIHHTGAEEKDAQAVRAYHKSLGWRDVGYHYLIERDGRVVPGRDLSLPGAHCRAGGMNYRGIGVACIGNFENHPPLPPQVEALAALLRRLLKEHGILPGNVLGHREVPGAATLCPGRFFKEEQIRALLASRPEGTRRQMSPDRGSLTQNKCSDKIAREVRNHER